MGVIRGILLVLVVVLLFFSFFATTLFYTLSLSLSYDNLQRESVSVVKDVLKEVNLTSIMRSQYNLINLYCKNNSDFVFNAQGYTFDIPCNTAMQGEDAIIEEAAKDLVHNIYYDEYNCGFIDCFRTSPVPLFLFSEKTYIFFTNRLYWLLTATLVLLGLSFLLMKKRTSLPILAGILLIVASLPFLKLDYFFSLYPDKIMFKLLKIFFSQAYFVSIRALIAGIILIIAGIVLKFFKIGFKISAFFSKIGGSKNKQDEDSSKKESRKRVGK